MTDAQIVEVVDDSSSHSLIKTDPVRMRVRDDF